MEKGKKYILIFAVALSTFLFIIDNTEAVSFNWSSSISFWISYSWSDLVLLPVITWWGASPRITWYEDSWVASYRSFWTEIVVNSDFNTLSWVLMTNNFYRQNNQWQSSWENLSIVFFKSAWYSRIEYVVSSNYANTYTWVLLWAYPLNQCVWLSTNCVLWIVYSFFSNSSWIWLSDVNVVFYHNDNYQLVLSSSDLVAELWSHGFYVSPNNWYIYGYTPTNSSLWWSWILDARYYQTYVYTWWSNLIWNFYLWSNTWEFAAIINKLPEYLGATWWIFIENTWSINTWSWFTDFFDYSACWSFLDVWCYIQETVSGLWNFGWSFFPEISFTWSSQTCMSWSTGAISSLSGNISYIQKLVNFSMVIIPIAPPEGTIVCMIGGMTGAVSYQANIPSQYRHNMAGSLSIIDVLMMSLIAWELYYFITTHHKAWWGVGGMSTVWKDVALKK